MTDIDHLVEALWLAFELEDNACVDREMDLIDTGGHYETFSMRRVAARVLAYLEPNDDGQFPTQTEMDAEDREDYYRIISWIRENRPDTRLAGEHPADWIIRVLDMSPKLIETIEELRAVPRNPLLCAGPLLKCNQYPDFGAIYEGNDDGTWNNYDDPKQGHVAPEDINLPALLLYVPSPD
jgi:hypothetical protein